MYEVKQRCINRVYSNNSLVLQNSLLVKYSRLKKHIIYDLNDDFDFTKFPKRFFLIAIVKSGKEYVGIVNYIKWKTIKEH